MFFWFLVSPKTVPRPAKLPSFCYFLVPGFLLSLSLSSFASFSAQHVFSLAWVDFLIFDAPLTILLEISKPSNEETSLPSLSFYFILLSLNMFQRLHESLQNFSPFFLCYFCVPGFSLSLFSSSFSAQDVFSLGVCVCVWIS